MRSVKFSIRDAYSNDLDAMVGLLRQLFAIEKDYVFDENKQRHGCAAMLAEHGHCIVKIAEVKSVVVGMCTAQINVSTAEGGMSALVEDCIVDAHYRGKGIGTALLSAIHKWAADRGCLRLQLLADQRNKKALTFYRHVGLKETNMICLSSRIFDGSLFQPSPRHHMTTTRR